MSPERKQIDSFGKKGKRNYVRIVREPVGGVTKIRVLWKEPHRLVESFEDTRNGLREARAFAEGKHEALTAPIVVATYEPKTIRDLFDAYVTAKVDAWRPRTLELERERWRAFELFANRATLAAQVRAEMLDLFKRELLKQGRAINQVRQTIDVVKRVFSFAVRRDLIAPTKVTVYEAEFSKDARQAAPKMAEFVAADRDLLIAKMDPRHVRQWRTFVLTTLIGYCGPRQKAAMHLRWSDVDFDTGLITWRAEFDKRGNERRQPMPEPVRDALWVAYGWRLRERYAGEWVFFAVQERGLRKNRPWSYAAYIEQLHAFERAVGMQPVKYKGAHAFRRGVAGNVLSLTGSEKRAAEWIGDKDVRVVKKSYLLEREEELRKTAALVSERNGMQSGAESVESVKSEVVDSQPLNREPAVGIEPTTARSQE